MRIAQRLHERCACASLGAGSFALAGTERKYERSRPFLVTHTFLDLSLDFAAKAVSGTARLDLRRVSPDAETVQLDAIGFELFELLLISGKNSRQAEFEYDGETLTVLGLGGLEQFQIEVRYCAVPRRGLYFLAPDSKVKDRPVQVWSQCQDEDARHWFPCHDKPHVKMTTELRVEVPTGFVALSNGEQIAGGAKPAKSSAKRAGAAERATFHFKLDKPHPSYLVTLVVGEFSIENDRDAKLEGGRSVPVQYYVPKSRAGDAARSFGETPRMIELFSKLTGVPFPWSRYSQVVVNDFVFGGMENTTATTMYEHVLLDQRAALDIQSHDLVAHELAHQWFGDFVTCRDWSHAWLNEGFATYFEQLEREDREGRDAYDYGIETDRDTYLSEAGSRYQRPVVCRDYHEPIDLFDRHLYEKGALVLHLLRRELGDASFFQGVRDYLQAHAHSLVETVDLQRALERVSGRSLERFFDQWIFRPGHPDLKIKVSYEDGLLVVSLKQAQKGPETAIFELEFEIEVQTEGGAFARHRKRVTASHDQLVVPLGKRPAYVAFDPEQRVIGQISVEAPADMLRRQLTAGSSAFVRWSAAAGLAKKPDPTNLSALDDALGNEKESWMVRVEAARALGKTRAPAALDALAKHTKVKHPKVRRAVAAALGAFRDERAVELLRPLAQRDASYLVEAEAARALGKTKQKAALKPLLAMVDRKSWADVVRSGTLDGLSALRDEAGLPEVLERTRYGYPSRGRRAAVGALAELGEGKKVREHLESLLDDGDPHLRADVASALLRLGDHRCRPALRRALDREIDGRVARRLREALRDLGEGASERKRVADELESLRGELLELKARLAKIEAKKPDKSKDKAEKTRKKSAPRKKSKR
ncbi:MAG TPA: M1 family aminopeptidase [Polyangiaceae bacterium]|nr:M1 family aminopeptidase [Polyangiaceae bacterium]